MKKILVLVLIMSCICLWLFSNEKSWEDHWINSLEARSVKNYHLADAEIVRAIDLLKQEDGLGEDHAHLYIERSNILLYLKKYSQAIQEASKALSYSHINVKDRIQALQNRACAYANLEMIIEMANDNHEWEKLYGMPSRVISDKYLIIRNMPTDQTLVNDLIDAYLKCSVFGKREDLKIYENGTWIIEKQNACSCKALAHNDQIFDGRNPNNPGNMPVVNPGRVNECKFWCDKTHTIWDMWVSAKFPSSTKCYWVCKYIILDPMRDACHWCCSGGSFYDRCIQPFEKFIEMCEYEGCAYP